FRPPRAPLVIRRFRTLRGRCTTRSTSFSTIERRPHVMKYPWTHKTFFNRPHWTRRGFFELLGSGVTGAFLAERYGRAADLSAAGAGTKGTAKNVVSVLLAGAPSHTDTFDFKQVNGVTPATFKPESVNGILWPTGLLPKLGNMVGNFAVVRSMRAHAV